MRERIKRVMARIFGVPIAAVPDDADVNGFAQWDSLRHLELMVALEMEFGVRISSEAMVELLSLEAIEEYVRGQATPA